MLTRALIREATMLRRLRDWWRGYSDEDVDQARWKADFLRRQNHPAHHITLTGRELLALTREGLGTC
jgi:hypothetical protein